jgi:histidinol-phosphate/aromatic aminotransferase/cobyric acid decarboxylase-like protein
MYCEYRHLAENVSRCRVEYAKDGHVDYPEATFDLVVKVNPNNPTGRAELAETLLSQVPPARRILVDEAYRDYFGDDYSLEQQAARSSGIFVLKSMSKGFALSGLRVAYLVGPPEEIKELAHWSPPWAVGLSAQIAAVRALESPDYYAQKYADTKVLVADLAAKMANRGHDVVGGVNWILVRVESAEKVTRQCRDKGLFIRNAGLTAPSYGDEWVRIAVPRPEIEAEFWSRFDSIFFEFDSLRNV